MIGSPEVGEILKAAMPKIKKYLDDVVQQQYDMCMKKGFNLKKYYIWILYYKNNHTNKLVLRPAICRVTRPSPYQDEDMFLWSVTDYDKVKFEYAIPKAETLNYILANPEKFDRDYVAMLRRYVGDKLEKLDDYVVQGKIA
jgi:hypothetical protein